MGVLIDISINTYKKCIIKHYDKCKTFLDSFLFRMLFFFREIGDRDDDKKDDIELENDIDDEAHFRDNLRDAQLLSDLNAENYSGNSSQKSLVLSPSKVGKGIFMCDRCDAIIVSL
jgi:hypothetical protein